MGFLPFPASKNILQASFFFPNSYHGSSFIARWSGLWRGCYIHLGISHFARWAWSGSLVLDEDYSAKFLRLRNGLTMNYSLMEIPVGSW